MCLRLRVFPKALRLVVAATLFAASLPLLAQSQGAPLDAGRQRALAPAEVYGAVPKARMARLSPDGTWLALIAPVDGHDALVTWALDRKDKPLALPLGDAEPAWFAWKSDRRLIVALRIFAKRNFRRPTLETRLVALDRDGGNIKDLVPAALFRTYAPQFEDQVVSLLRADPDHILLELPAVDRQLVLSAPATRTAQVGGLEERIKYPEVVRVDVASGKLETVLHQRDGVVRWRADEAGQVRIARGLRGSVQDFQVRSAAGDAWRTLQSFEVNSGRVFAPLDFLETNPDHLYALSNHEGGRNVLYEVDPATDAFVRKVAESSTSNIEPVLRDGRLLGYRLVHDGAPVYFVPADAQDAKLVERAFPGARNELLDRSLDGKRTLVLVAEGNQPPTYWLLERSTGRPTLTPLAETYPALEPAQIAPTRTVSYRARDGLAISALLTLPPHPRPDAVAPPLPFVVLPHDGPTYHDVPGFDYLVQFLASRGYGVLQPQFRGSTGHGAAFEAAGHQQWGLAMQDDVTDGTRWLIEQRLADPARIAIVGASYGGYAALMGVVKEPDLYRCAAAIAPVTDLNLLLDSNWKMLFADVNLPRIGTDPAVLERTSPARNAGRIRVPLLLVHGRSDAIVPVEQTETMVDALAKAARPYELLYLDQADHVLSRSDDRIATLKALEAFLAKQLAAR